MKESSISGILFFLIIVIIILSDSSCKKDNNPVKFTKGTFPDTIMNLVDLNSPFDDYNVDLEEISGNIAIIFSSNRKSSGRQFDIEQGIINYHFDVTNGNFGMESAITNDSFTSSLISKAVTAGDDLGPYRFFSTSDGYEYFVLSSSNETGKLDLFYLKNLPVYGTNIPEIKGPYPVSLLNSASDDAYFCTDVNMDSLYFSSNREGNFDIYLQKISNEKPLSEIFNLPFIYSSKTDNINSSEDEKCPNIHKGVMVFASNRLGGMGGFDLYYSVFKTGNWSSPVNFGPKVNTSSDEYRPVLGSVEDFTNSYMVFSSNRPGGKGEFDLYFMGLELPK
ncbi:MAG TPA: hypothetical protein VMV47_18535 [Bacteroidales bacterium]|nr:hypothetical protein [Bacteroidales bacterium]